MKWARLTPGSYVFSDSDVPGGPNVVDGFGPFESPKSARNFARHQFDKDWEDAIIITVTEALPSVEEGDWWADEYGLPHCIVRVDKTLVYARSWFTPLDDPQETAVEASLREVATKWTKLLYTPPEPSLGMVAMVRENGGFWRVGFNNRIPGWSVTGNGASWTWDDFLTDVDLTTLYLTRVPG